MRVGLMTSFHWKTYDQSILSDFGSQIFKKAVSPNLLKEQNKFPIRGCTMREGIFKQKKSYGIFCIKKIPQCGDIVSFMRSEPCFTSSCLQKEFLKNKQPRTIFGRIN